VVCLLCIFKIDGDIKHLNSFVDLLLTGIWTNFPTFVGGMYGRPRLVILGVKCFNYDTTKSFLRNNPAWNKDDIELVI